MQRISLLIILMSFALMTFGQKKKKERPESEEQRKEREEKECTAKGWMYGKSSWTYEYVCYDIKEYPVKYPLVAQPEWKKTGGLRNATRDIAQVTEVVVTPQGHILASGWNAGLYISKDKGATFNKISLKSKGWADEELSIDRIVFSKEGFIFAATKSNGIYRSKNNGENWIELNIKNKIPEGEEIRELVYHPSGNLFALIEDNGLWRSKNNGDSWERVSTGLPDKFYESKGRLALTTTGELYLGCAETNISAEEGIYVSNDIGSSWTMVSDFSAFDKLKDRDRRREYPRLQSLFVTDDHAILVGTNDGIVMSTDGGKTWNFNDKNMCFYTWDANYYAPTPSDKFRPSINHFMRDGNNFIYAVTYNVGLFMSKDNGRSWIRLMDEKTKLYHVSALAISKEGILYAGSDNSDYSGYIYSSTHTAQTVPADMVAQVKEN